MATTKKRTPKPTGATATEPRALTISGWSVSRIEAAKRLADSGDLSAAADLWERVLGDERALGPLQALAGIAGLEMRFETAVVGSDSDDDPLVEALERDWWALFPEDLQGEILRWAAGIGVVPVHAEEWTSDPETGRLLPRYSVWHPRVLRWDGDAATWKVRTRENAQGVTLTPGDSEWMLLCPYGQKRPWTKAPWFGLGLLWFIAQTSKIDWAGWNDSHAQPIRAAQNEKAETHGLLDEAQQRDLATKVASLVRGGALVLPDGYGLKLIEAESKNWESFVKLCDEVWPKAVAIALTGNNLTTQVDGGSFAAAKEATGVAFERKRTFAKCLETTFRTEGLVWWAEFNFAGQPAPWPRYGVEPPTDLTAAAARFQSGANGLVALTSAGFEVEDGEEDKLEGLLGLRVRRAKSPPPAAPKQPPTAAKAHEHTRSASGNEADPLVRGQLFADELVQQAIEVGAAELSPDLETLTRMIREAKDLRALRLELVMTYSGMSPKAFASVVERAEVLAAMAGRWSAAADV